MKTWTTIKTDRGFERIEFNDHNGENCSLQQSSAIGDAPDAIDSPGTSLVWLGRDGERMHLDRKQVYELVRALTDWLDFGSFAVAPRVLDTMRLLDQAQDMQRDFEQEISDLKQQLKDEREMALRAVIEAQQDCANDAYAEGRHDEREKQGEKWGWC